MHQLTDETDTFFLYTLRISEEEFQSVKLDQSILVDFAEFPQRFLDLLRFCLPSSDTETPNFAVLKYLTFILQVTRIPNLDILVPDAPYLPLTQYLIYYYCR